MQIGMKFTEPIRVPQRCTSLQFKCSTSAVGKTGEIMPSPFFCPLLLFNWKLIYSVMELFNSCCILPVCQAAALCHQPGARVQLHYPPCVRRQLKAALAFDEPSQTKLCGLYAFWGVMRASRGWQLRLYVKKPPHTHIVFPCLCLSLTWLQILPSRDPRWDLDCSSSLT